MDRVGPVPRIEDVQILGKGSFPLCLRMLQHRICHGDKKKVSQKGQHPKENPSQKVVVENTVRIANNQDIPRIPTTSFMGGNKDSTQMWVNQTTSNKNVVEHPSTSQLDQDIQAFSKEEMDYL
ncbi:hypothetical protein CR513_22437, partial [Mucuna pruriens]